MNLYHITIWDDRGGKDNKGISVHLVVVAKDDVTALQEAKSYRGQLTQFSFQQSDVIIAK